MDQGSNKNHYRAYNFAPTVTKFCVMWEGLSLPHDTKFGNCRCEIVDSRAFPSWSLIHGLRWSGLIKAEPGFVCPRALVAFIQGFISLGNPPWKMLPGSLKKGWCGSDTFLAMARPHQIHEHRFNHFYVITHDIDGLVPDCSNSSANALELLQSYTKPVIYLLINSSLSEVSRGN